MSVWVHGGEVGLYLGPTPATGVCFTTGFNDRYHDQSLLGKRVKVVRGDCEVGTPVCMNKTGKITGWYDADVPFGCLIPASCEHMAVVSGDNGETFHANTSWCDIIS